jgi:NAD(P)-dependent dehydrogenase (short-subunit alcohol dehydrogenase family)
MRILITGAARGLGWHMAGEAVRRGHTVFAAVRPESATADLETLLKEYPNLLSLLRMDVASQEQVRAAVRLIEGQSERWTGSSITRRLRWAGGYDRNP